MIFIFVKDRKGKYRYFSSEPPRIAEIKTSKAKEAWTLARKKLMLLPKRTLRMEQAFERALRHKGPLRILYAAGAEEDKIRSRFSFFLQKQRTQHIIVLAAEAIVLPFTGIAALLPGPNIIFYALALLMITQWFALRGLGRTIRAGHEFIPDESLAAWEKAVEAGAEDRAGGLLETLGDKFGIRDMKKILG